MDGSVDSPGGFESVKDSPAAKTTRQIRVRRLILSLFLSAGIRTLEPGCDSDLTVGSVAVSELFMMNGFEQKIES